MFGPRELPARYSHGWYRLVRRALWSIAVVHLGFAFVTVLLADEARTPAYALYVALSCVSLSLIFCGRFSWFYLFFSAFLFLGLFSKTSIFQSLGLPFIEPVGQFTGQKEQWARYYIFASAGLLGAILGRAASLKFNLAADIDCYQQGASVRDKGRVPIWLWILLVTCIALTYTLNSYGNFFVTGVQPLIRLPLGLNAPISFVALVGMSLLVSFVVGHDYLSRGRLSLIALSVLILQGTLASISMFSRAAFVMQVIPALLAVWYERLRYGSKGFQSTYAILVTAAVFVGVLVSVSVLRLSSYYAVSVANPAEFAWQMVTEVATLPFGRWIGAEGIMSAISSDQASLSLFMRALGESPGEGVFSIYQQVAGSTYEFLNKNVFLTLPGLLGVFALSGSATVVCLGVLLTVLIGVVVERLAGILVKQRICLAVVSAALANAFAQLSFPRLLVPFIFQLLAVCGLLLIFRAWAYLPRLQYRRR